MGGFGGVLEGSLIWALWQSAVYALNQTWQRYKHYGYTFISEANRKKVWGLSGSLLDNSHAHSKLQHLQTGTITNSSKRAHDEVYYAFLNINNLVISF